MITPSLGEAEHGPGMARPATARGTSSPRPSAMRAQGPRPTQGEGGAGPAMSRMCSRDGRRFIRLMMTSGPRTIKAPPQH